VISPTQRPLPDNTQHSQETDIHAPGGIRTRNTSKRTAKTHALERAATGIGNLRTYFYKNVKSYEIYKPTNEQQKI
jgi:hypothetical protein